MKVYIDLLIIVNFFFDFLLLLGVKKVLKRKTSILKVVLASLLGEISCITLFLPLSTISLFLVKLLISILLILIAFGYQEKAYFEKNLLYFYILSIVLGGMIYFLKLSFNTDKDLIMNLIFLLIIAPYLLRNYIKEEKRYKSNYSLRHNIDIYLDKKKYSYIAYLDTGNKLEDPYKKRPIILVHDNTLNFTYENSILVPYKTLDHEGIIKCQKPEKIVVDEKYELKNILVGKSIDKFNIEGIDVILPNIMKEELK